ncbi:MAG TPA: UDP-3-O-(3-hydroxymyristoyl)glucosamine N-acyltransferase [Acidobacteriota bacterium]|jgi:UDP-3-O-[3-hydroxymyristoyl] glucosamine N-acyltransferase|nr:UDP-3-O-(3-hydroxymyristoyl)glucosamine N-acyltransferase [Acidobacteriota bacterium]
MKLGDIARTLQCELRGPEDLEITGVAPIQEAVETELTFVANPKYYPQLSSTRAAAVILGKDAPPCDRPTLVSSNPYLAFAKAVELFYRPPRPVPGIHPTAVIADTAVIGENPSIGANVVIGDHVRIGARAVIHPNVTIYPCAEIGDDFVAHSDACVREYCRLGDRVILQNGAVVGADGFGFAPQEDGSFYKIVQAGIVILEDDVELGAHACVDRATVGETRIGRGTKIDNLVQIGHGSRVGEHNVLAAQVGLAGSTRVGNHVMLAGQVGAAGHLSIGDRVVATAQTGIARDVPEGARISGTPEMDSALWKKNYILMHEFPQLVKTIKRLEKEVARLRERLGDEG